MVVFDVVEDILSRSAVEDLIKWKRVCKLWYSLISSPSFVRLHLKITSSNNRHLRIMMPTYWKTVEKISNESLCEHNSWWVVGSSNGLVCFSRMFVDALTVINNPWTREVTKVPMSPLVPQKIENLVTFGFGYDSYTDDYKVFMAIWNRDLEESLVQVLSLKTNTWKLIGQFKYWICYNRPGILCNGALYWLAFDFHVDSEEPDQVYVILSFDLFREEFTVIQEPNDSRYDPYDRSIFTALGMLEDQLCFFTYNRLKADPPHDIWVMRSYNVEESWELLSDDYKIKYEVVHYMNMLDCISPKETTMSFFCNHNNKCVLRAWKYICAQKFVPSLVSPHTGRPDPPKNNKSFQMWSTQVAEGECPHMQAKTRKFIKTTEHVENVHRLEFGDQTQNLYLLEDAK